MKYNELLQLKEFFCGFKKLDFARRIDDNILELSFDRHKFLFDLNRRQSTIYTADLEFKNYNAPFDFMLKKYLNNVFVRNVLVPHNNRILCFHFEIQKAYKSYTSKLYFEFTGRNTNAILTDENETIIEALRHIEKSYRIIKPKRTLVALEPFNVEKQGLEIKDFKAYFQNNFKLVYTKRLEQKRTNKLAELQKRKDKLQKVLTTLEDESTLLQKAHDLQNRADVLFAHLHQIKSYERKFNIRDFQGKEMHFDLDLSPKESANQYYKQAKKFKQKAKNLLLQRQNLQEKLDFEFKLTQLIQKAQSEFELESILPKKKREEKKENNGFANEKAIAKFYYNEFKICVGKNEKANEFLLKNAKKNDMWLHIRGLSSSHVIIISNKQKISQEVLQFAAKLCVNFSKVKKGLYWVDYTLRNCVKVKEKAFVEYKDFKSIKVEKD
ncbi:NFACT RNA binding domain-containing protein [Campylobacter sp. MIT 21-1685]|uniref:NFACT RNA binding domain-containing protein n=1 Tax=unclassified Campylobacter TaxID=2593542 RepID=UPI00224A5099|nr:MULTISPECIES: NFACT RNA binding domain-containing protein [unclassified Campylobacter]MCX2683510.1 NFACT RNA binding domain-containing protein [Campylobacter sp. MIT 21-1684]MCX2751791.1 NFACT RNA binding domain-containing protein [Campylobacter sp. MIT 21-1682]MCX2807992.1 NFACT RNA binding domain-containing protein [Campylobacter sp. MIT 21-1685]